MKNKKSVWFTNFKKLDKKKLVALMTTRKRLNLIAAE